MKLRSLLVGLISIALLGAIAPSAMAEDFCVGISAPRCPASEYPLTSGDLLTAIDDADNDPGADTVVIAPHVFAVSSSLVLAPDADTSIVGAGPAQTVFQGALEGQPLVQILGATGSTMRGFSVDVNGETANTAGSVGLSLRRTKISDFKVQKSDDAFSRDFVALDIGDGAVAEDGNVTMLAGAAIGVHVKTGSATLERVDIESGPFHGITVGVLGDSPEAAAILNLRHVTVSEFFTGVSLSDMEVNITDSLIDIGTLSLGSGIAAGAYGTKTIDLNVARVTVVGRGADQTGFNLYADAAPASVDADLYDFISYVPPGSIGTYKTLYCDGASAATNSVSVDVEYFASWGGDTSINTGCSWDLEGDKTINFINDGGPDFRDFDGGDYRLLWNSPLIDFGDTQGSLTAADADLAGAKRLVDGNGDDIAKPDLGAYEYQRLPPEVTIQADKTTVARGEEVTFNGSADDPEGEAVILLWDFGDGAVDDSHTEIAKHSYAAFGTYTAKVTARDDTGAESTATVTISVPDPTVKPPIVALPPAPNAVVTAKAKKSFKAGQKGFSVAKKGQPSFTVRFANAAAASLTVQSIGKDKKLKNTKVKTRLAVKDGATKIFFGGGKLKAGKYRVTITPIAATGTTGTPVSTTIVVK
jgi:PKD repeat protein